MKSFKQFVTEVRDMPPEHKAIYDKEGSEGYHHFLRKEKLKKQPTMKQKLDVLSQWRKDKHINSKQYERHIKELE